MRIVIVDFNHMAHTYFHTKFRLSVRKQVGGTVIEKDTTVQSGVLKCINRWSDGGRNIMVVCFDRPVPARKAYFMNKFSDPEADIETRQGAYKGGRPAMPDMLYEAMQDCQSILEKAGCTCLFEHNYEADDLVMATIVKAKKEFPGVPIDVITNDADLVPLVDDVVSVFLRSRVTTYAEIKALEKAHYVQITPKNYQEVLEGLSSFKDFLVPYNTVLLHKLLRGDSADNIQGIKKLFPPRKYNEMIQGMLSEEDLGEAFRYQPVVRRLVNIETGEELPGQENVRNEEDLYTLVRLMTPEDRKKYAIKPMGVPELDRLCELVKKYAILKEGQFEIVEEHLKKLYYGMNLNQMYTSKEKALRRSPYCLTAKGKSLQKLDQVELRKACLSLEINIKVEGM